MTDPVAYDFDFRQRVPGGTLGRAVASVWYARGTVPYARERIAPTGSTVAVIVLGAPIHQTPDDGGGATLEADHGFLVGPHDRPVVNEPTGETHAVGIVTTPVGCEAALGLRPDRLRATVVDLRAWPDLGVVRPALLALDGQPDRMLDLVVDHLTARLDLDVAAFDRCEAAVALLEADPTRAVTDVAAELAVSSSQLGRDLSRVVGMSPRVLARLLRVRHLLAGIDARGDVAWAGLAADLGWYDQSHMVRDVRRHTGVPPSRYLAAQRGFAPSDVDDTSGFVPEV